MTQPRWYSQPFPPAGSISAEGIKRTLGKPPIPWTAILVRESAQNSWDARVGDRPVHFALDLAIVPPQNANAWRTLLLEGAPHSDQFPLRQTLRGREWHSTMVRTLTISDRGTKGLGGPTRADTARGDEPRDWVSFVLNVGDPPDTRRGGGTYGYGKGILYQMSRAGTIVVHTRTVTARGAETRLIGICLGESLELTDAQGTTKPYTGRHWWGAVESEHVEPLVGHEASGVAAALGIRPFAAHESGTDVVIVDPDFGDATDEETARYLADAIAWNLWPIMLEQRGEERLVPEVWHRGLNVPVPAPERTRGLRTFVAAYRRLEDNDGGDVQTLMCGSPKKPLGRLALERQLIPPYEPPAAAQDLGITHAPHHVCLMRAPELVVKYHPGPEPISANLAYAGVFRAFDDMDRTYAGAEPPTHDDWVYAQLDGQERTFVRTTFVRIKERLAEFARPAEVKSQAVRTPLGAVSNFLGSLVAAATGSGAASAVLPPPFRSSDPIEPSGASGASVGEGGAPEQSGTRGPTPPSGRSVGGRASVRLDGEPYFEHSATGLLLVQEAVVTGSGRLTAEASVGITVADGGREQDPPDGSESPRILCWRIEGTESPGSSIILEDATTGQRLALVIRPVPDTITQVEIATVREGVTAGAR